MEGSVCGVNEGESEVSWEVLCCVRVDLARDELSPLSSVRVFRRWSGTSDEKWAGTLRRDYVGGGLGQ